MTVKKPRDINTIKQAILDLAKGSLTITRLTSEWFLFRSEMEALALELKEAEDNLAKSSSFDLHKEYAETWAKWIKSWELPIKTGSTTLNLKKTSFEDGDDPACQPPKCDSEPDCLFCQLDEKQVRLIQSICDTKMCQDEDDTDLCQDEDLSHRQRASLHWMAMMLWGVMSTIDNITVDKETYYALSGCQYDIGAVLERIDREVSTHEDVH